MGTHHGNEGVVKVGSNAIAEIQSYELNESIEMAENHSMGDTWKTHITGVKSWQGSVTCWWDEADTNGQQALTNGASVTLNLYPEGDASTDVYKTGTATVSEVQISAAKDGIVTCTFNFTGNGALTQAVVGA